MCLVLPRLNDCVTAEETSRLLCSMMTASLRMLDVGLRLDPQAAVLDFDGYSPARLSLVAQINGDAIKHGSCNT